MNFMRGSKKVRRDNVSFLRGFVAVLLVFAITTYLIGSRGRHSFRQ